MVRSRTIEPSALKPMEAEAVTELPRGPQWFYEPKYDGFRCIAYGNGKGVDLRSKVQKPLARYIPEVAAGLADLASQTFVLDGELVIAGGTPSLVTRGAASPSAWFDPRCRKAGSGSQDWR